MGKWFHHCAQMLLFFIIVLCPAVTAFAETSQIKVSVFNFTTVDLEASGYNSTVANMLLSSLSSKPSLALLSRKELEKFLSRNDLQQDDNLNNVIHIGSRLGLSAIVVGIVGKRGSVITIHCKAVHIEQKRIIFESIVKAFGDTELPGEIEKLSVSITEAITGSVLAPPRVAEKATKQSPLNVRKRPGANWVGLNWEAPPGMAVSGYKIFRSKAKSGPFTKIDQVDQPEYLDKALDRNTLYYYKIRAYTVKGLRSDFSEIISAETAPTPNPPVILKAEGHIKSMELTWSPCPIARDDKLSLKGYKLYRANGQKGPYKEVANIPSADPGTGVATSEATDKVLRVTYLDKGLSDGKDYFYKLTAYNEKNLESDFSSAIKGVTTPIISGLSVQGNMIREIKIVWNIVESPFVKGYYVYRSTSENENYMRIKKLSVSDAGGGKRIEYADREGLQDSTRYFYRITAVEDSGTETSPSLTVSAVTKGKPATLQGFQARSGLVKKVELSWPVNPSEEIEGYNLYVATDQSGKFSLLKRIQNRLTNNFVHGGALEKLEDGTTYYYFIKTFNKVNVESDPSETISATTKPRPAKPSGLRGDSLKVKEVPLAWQPNPEKDIAIYYIYRASGSEDFVQIAKISVKTDYQDKGLKDGSIYKYKIKAEDKDELVSDFSDAISVHTKPAPRKIKGVTGRISEGNVILTWEPGSESDIAHYVVYEKGFFGLQKIGTVAMAAFSETAPPKGKSKVYVITSVDKDGLESEPSQEVTVGEK